MSRPSRGIRNNNPGNLVYNAKNNWRGQLPHDPTIETRFVRFDTAFNGIRALAKLLLNYRKIHGLRTIEALVSRFAPSNENDTKGYARFVAEEMGISAYEPLHLDKPTLQKLIPAIITQENGQQPYSPHLISAAIDEVLQ
ncbi:structural protein [Pseudomonas sp. F1_0610]|uniref:structural protein n=1 Tax=Pseudomonas sp. F1_0610 TaxID=3114284 RepID=UPI0039C2196A